MNIKHTTEFDLAYRFVTETSLNVFLTGKAGTGKTTFLKYLRENTFKKMVVAAPTGVAAINAGGVTLHSLFQLPFAPFIPTSILPSSTIPLSPYSEMENVRNGETQGGIETLNSHSLLSQIRYRREKLNLLRNLELLVIDEVSMMASHTVDAIDTILRNVKRQQHLPFGGTQILFIGDLHQLPPVVKNQEWEFLQNFYPSIFFFDSIVLKENPPVLIELKEIFRQQDNTFINILNEIRNNHLTKENFDLLNLRLKPDFAPADEEEYVTLTTHNYQADEINKRKLKKLPAYSGIYHAEVRGNYPEHLFPAEHELKLKPGAQVMFLKNDTEEKKYFNGKIGTVTLLNEDMVKVKCKDEQPEIEVKKYEWKNINYSFNPDTRQITEEELGSFLQYPLRLAWAITIHKSQGLTFNKLIVDAENAFANGQVYVALSRCTSLEGLILTSPVNQKFLGAHRNLKEWQEKNQNDENLPDKFQQSRQQYILQELQTLFIFNRWSDELQELHKMLSEEKENISSDYSGWLNELIEKQKTISLTAEKFIAQIHKLCDAENNSAETQIKHPVSIEENPLLQNRIRDAVNYFSAEIAKWKEKLSHHPLSTDTKKVARKTDDFLNEINFIVHELLSKMDYCKNGFLLDDYLKKGKNIKVTIKKIQSSYSQHRLQSAIPVDLEHPLLYGRMIGLRNRLAEKMNRPLSGIFRTRAIIKVCMYLPATKENLQRITGFGRTRVEKYGDEVIKLVQEYCQEKNIETQQIFKEKFPGEKMSVTIEETLKHLKEGKSIEEAAKARNFAVSTIEGHLAHAIKNDWIQIEEVITMEEVNKIAQYFPAYSTESQTSFSFSSIKEKLPDASYGKLRMVFAWMEKEKKIL